MELKDTLLKFIQFFPHNVHHPWTFKKHSVYLDFKNIFAPKKSYLLTHFPWTFEITYWFSKFYFVVISEKQHNIQFFSSRCYKYDYYAQYNMNLYFIVHDSYSMKKCINPQFLQLFPVFSNHYVDFLHLNQCPSKLTSLWYYLEHSHYIAEWCNF